MSTNGQENFEFFTSPFLTASFRNYYKRRKVKKNDLRNNSGNYVGLLSTYSFKSIVNFGDATNTNTGTQVSNFTTETEDNSHTIGPVWGFQRNYASGIHFDLSIGLGYRWVERVGNAVDDVNGLTIHGGLEFGFRFN